MSLAMRTLARWGSAWSLRVAPALAPMLLGWASMGCSPQIGSSCNLSTDCSSQGDRVCDTAQPGGYCTILNCNSFSCPDHAVCVMFESTVPGCNSAAPFGDYQQPSRTGVALCMQHCGNSGDCRSGYECVNPTNAPWNASIISDNQSLSVCISPWAPIDVSGTAPPADPPDGSVCVGIQPPLASFPDAAPDAPADAPADAADGATGTDAGAGDAADDGGSALDATSDAADGESLDGADGASIDSGAADGPTGD
jgi:hypothetical protein